MVVLDLPCKITSGVEQEWRVARADIRIAS